METRSVGIMATAARAVVMTAGLLFGPGFRADAAMRPADPPLVEVVSAVDRSLVHITAGPWVGSGFLFGGPRWVVTNRHVVEEVGLDGAVTVRPLAEADDGRMTLGTPVEAVVRSFHPTLDLAVVEVLGRLPQRVRPLPVVEQDRLLPRGTEVLVHGFPATMVPTVGRGIVSAHHHDFADDEPLYLLDAASGSGSSGGPVTDRGGRLIGVATAVYDTELAEDLGFAWCFAIPALHVQSLFDARGGLVATPRTSTVEELIERVRNAAPGTARLEAFRDGVAAILASRTRIRSLTEDLEQFVERGQAWLVLESSRDGRLFMDSMLDMSAAGARRGVELGLQGDEALEDLDFLAELEERQRRLQVVGMSLMERSLGQLSEARGLALVEGMLESIAARAEVVADAAADAVRVLEPVVGGDVQAMRGTARAATVAAMADLTMLQMLLEFRAHVPALSPQERREIPRSLAAAIDRVDVAMTRLERRLMGLPPEVRALLEGVGQDGGLTAADVRATLELQGFTSGEPVFLELGPNGDVREHRIRFGGPAAIAFLAESLDGSDIDLVLESPSGQEIDTDRAIDAFPLVTAESPVAGTWRLRLINAGGRRTSVRLEVWQHR